MTRAAVLVLALLGGCTASQIDESAHLFAQAAPLLALIPGPAGPACVIAAKLACAVAEAASEWPDGAGVEPAALDNRK